MWTSETSCYPFTDAFVCDVLAGRFPSMSIAIVDGQVIMTVENKNVPDETYVLTRYKV